MVVATAVVVLLVLLLVGLRRPRPAATASGAPPPPKHYPLRRDDHARKQLEERLAPLNARVNAPPGKTPCETAYNGFKGFLDADKSGRNTTFALPPRDDFLRRCESLTEPERRCLEPVYPNAHPEECRPLFKSLSAKVFEPVKDSLPSDWPGDGAAK